jgi:succinyl-CoA synthetase beta subunit
MLVKFLNKSSLKLLDCRLSQLLLPKCNISLQEYQSKKLLEDNGINVQRFQMASTPDQAYDAGKNLLNTIASELVIKAQILAGGRGKGVFSSGLKGGVKLTKDVNVVKDLAKQMINYKLETKQTKPGGVLVEKLMIAEALDISRETYFAILLDRSYDGPVMIGSPIGGVDIEEVAENQPNKMFKDKIDTNKGITREQAVNMAKNLEFKGKNIEIAADQITKLYKLFCKLDCTQLEINPFGETPDGRVVCFDSKLNFDDNAEFRQRAIFNEQDLSETDPREAEAMKLGLNYIQMDGNIGCLVNGAGLAMATMDIITLHGGSPANFLDCGGNVNEKQVYEAFRILTSDTQVKAILVNIFGGIVNCATIANGIVSACKSIKLTVPLIVRLQGTNMEKANEIIKQSGLNIVSELDFDKAAHKACQMAK